MNSTLLFDGKQPCCKDIKGVISSGFSPLVIMLRKSLLLAISCIPIVLGLPVKRADPIGIDVSDFTTDIDWTSVVDNGVKFVYIKATEGTCEL